MKKGVSQMVSTVLLIAMAVSLATIIYSFNFSILPSLSPPADCAEVSVEVGFYEKDNKLFLEANNNGITSIAGFELSLENKDKGTTDKKLIPFALPSGRSFSQELTFPIPVNTKVFAVPQIFQHAKLLTCPDNSRVEVKPFLAGSGGGTPIGPANPVDSVVE